MQKKKNTFNNTLFFCKYHLRDKTCKRLNHVHMLRFPWSATRLIQVTTKNTKDILGKDFCIILD